MRHYCTLFDKNYLAKGLVMLESLKRHSSEPYSLHILAMDSETEDALKDFGYWEYTFTAPTFNRMPSFSSRPWREFCWTMASQFTEYVLNEMRRAEIKDIDTITYLDADLFFFSDPKPVHDEIGERSIGIIPHRFIPTKRYLEVNGVFNVGWVTFKNTPIGRECLARWAEQVRERCDESTCGDQKYLDEWPEHYGDEVCIIENIGANLAPWNVGNYDLQRAGKSDYVFVIGRHRADWLRFYHFHEYEHGVRLTNYDLRPEDIELIYKPYIEAINRAEHKIETLHLQSR